MIGDTGPYMNDEGDVWVPRTVPWKDARRLALTGVDYLYANQRFVYVGKEDADLLGFIRDCQCEETCEARYVDDEPTGERPCSVPSWHFQVVER